MRLSEMRTEVTPQKINKIMERSFGFSIDYDNLSYAKAQRLSKALTENIHAIKKSFGAHTAEKNAKYMELMMVKEGLDRWLNSEQGLFESEIGASEARLAAQDIVDSIQDMIEKIGKIQNEQVPALVATIRDQIGMEQSEQFKQAIKPVLDTLYQAVSSGQEQAESAVLQLAGEQPPAGDMNMGGMPGADMGTNDLGVPPPEGGADLDAEAPADAGSETDGFDAVDAAAGGSQALGRARR
jgi:hypothetical protein